MLSTMQYTTETDEIHSLSSSSLSFDMNSNDSYYTPYMLDEFYFNKFQKNVNDLQTNCQISNPLPYNIILHAPQAMMKQQDKEPITYLNRGQLYLLELEPTANNDIVNSTLSITFHEPSHQAIAENYWKYWIANQIPYQRAIDIDVQQSTGIFNIRFTSFDKINFDWHTRFGAKLYVHFHCLSTDFSRMKGVKGIPMRCVLQTDSYSHQNICYCKIKLFRDKGAERKNKDDRKQMTKQVEKVIAVTNGSPELHPLWPILSQPHQATTRLIEHVPKLSFYVLTLDSAPYKVTLDSLTTLDLKIKLAQFLSVSSDRIDDILWRQRNDILVLVEDVVIAEHVVESMVIMVHYEFKQDGQLRLFLEF